MKYYVMQLIADKECAQRDADNFERTLEECNEERQSLEEELESRKVYEIKIDWVLSDDESGVDTLIYSTEEKARQAFLAEIEKAKSDYDYAFNENGELEEDYKLEQGENYWHLYQDGFWASSHCLIMLTEKEVK